MIKAENKRWLVLVFGLCFLWWGYLMFASGMSLTADAIDYRDWGETLSTKGWAEYFRTGPNREPFYLWSVSVSMQIASFFSIDYQYVQKIFQILLLLSSQIFVLALLNKMKVRDSIKLFSVLYMGFSPSLVNGVFSLFSEVMTFPFILGIVWFASLSWESMGRGNIKKVALTAAGTGLMFLLSAATKGIFTHVFTIYLGFYFLLMIWLFIKRNKKAAGNILTHIAVCVAIFWICMGSFMHMNKISNGNFEYTNRYDWALFGMTYKRTDKFSARILLTHIVSIPGRNFCRLFLSEEDCEYCEHFASDYHSRVTLKNLLKDAPPGQHREKTVRLSFQAMIKNPLLYFLFTALEAPKMFFWETTKMGFVDYPAWLQKVHDFQPVRFGLRLVPAILTMCALVFMMLKTLKERAKFFAFDPEEAETPIRFLILFIIFSYTALYSLFLILARYTQPMGALYVVCIAYFLHNVIRPR